MMVQPNNIFATIVTASVPAITTGEVVALTFSFVAPELTVVEIMTRVTKRGASDFWFRGAEFVRIPAAEAVIPGSSSYNQILQFAVLLTPFFT